MSPILRARVLAAASFAVTSIRGLFAAAQEPAPPPPPPAATSPAPSAGPDLPAAPAAKTPADPTVVAPPLDPSQPAGPRSEKARMAAKQAELTPIVPSPHDVTRPAYQLFTETDLPLLGIGAVLASARFLRTQPAYCAPLCKPAELNALDRVTAGFYDAHWALVSDLAITSIGVGAVVFLLVDEPVLSAGNDAVVIAESALMATAFSSALTIAAGRPRPLLYGTKAPLDVRNGADAGLSFLSSHASVAFAMATSTFVTARRLHPTRGDPLPFILVGTGVGVASLVAVSRVMAGRHFITDTIGGAILGTAVGVIVPALHGSPVKVVPKVTATEGSLAVVGAF